MGISVGLVGLGSFGKGFAELFKKHPLVDRVALCDREPERVSQFAKRESWKDKFNPRDAYESLDDICKTDLDALVIITQPWLHAPQCVQAMDSGKHVYSAVPISSVPDDDEILDWCNRLVETCKRTGKYYMLGETTYYRPEAMFCRRKAREGAFGAFVYAEGQYYHDVDAACNLRRVSESRGASKAGQEWREQSRKYWARGVKSGPMHYPTHSTSGPVCVMNAHAVKVTAYGYANQNNDPFFKNSAFSNEFALFRMSNGATVRICECREIARPGEESFSVSGTKGSYIDGRWQTNHRDAPLTAKPLEVTQPTAEQMRDPLPPEVAEAWTDKDKCTVAYGGHGGSHAYLAHEFVSAVAHHRQPAINVWEAARYMAMGVMAHKSALKDGETLDVPDWGDAPAS
jgi:predicted dehydrogenase